MDIFIGKVEQMAVGYSLPAIFMFVFKNKYGYVCCVLCFQIHFCRTSADS